MPKKVLYKIILIFIHHKWPNSFVRGSTMKMYKGLPNKYEWGSFHVQFPSYLEMPCHTIQKCISPTVSVVRELCISTYVYHSGNIPSVMWFLHLSDTIHKKELCNSKPAKRLFSTYYLS